MNAELDVSTTDDSSPSKRFGCLLIRIEHLGMSEVVRSIYLVMRQIDWERPHHEYPMDCYLNRRFLICDDQYFGSIQVVAPADLLDCLERRLQDIGLGHARLERHQPGTYPELRGFCRAGSGPMGLDFTSRAINEKQHHGDAMLWSLILVMAERDGLMLPAGALLPTKADA